MTSDNVLFYGYLIALDTSYENINVFAGNIREETLQSDDIQSVTDYRAFIMPCCLLFLFDEAWRTIPQIMFEWYKYYEFDIRCILDTDLIKLHLKIVGNLLWKHRF